MIHLNGNIIAAIDTETTGSKPGFHDIIQIAILPLDNFLNPLKINGEGKPIMPFYINMRPRFPDHIDPEAMRVHQISNINTGLDPFRASDLLDNWFDKLKLPEGKRLVPLATNWPFDRPMILDWLGEESFNRLFDVRYRDVMTTTLFLNDRAELHKEPIPFPKNNLRYIASCLKIPYEVKHDALHDCVVTAEAYKRCMRIEAFNSNLMGNLLKPFMVEGEHFHQTLERLLKSHPQVASILAQQSENSSADLDAYGRYSPPVKDTGTPA
jgi:DNA polymerase III epsilon subunit-like protein